MLDYVNGERPDDNGLIVNTFGGNSVTFDRNKGYGYNRTRGGYWSDYGGSFYRSLALLFLGLFALWRLYTSLWVDVCGVSAVCRQRGPACEVFYLQRTVAIRVYIGEYCACGAAGRNEVLRYHVGGLVVFSKNVFVAGVAGAPFNGLSSNRRMALFELAGRTNTCIRVVSFKKTVGSVMIPSEGNILNSMTLNCSSVSNCRGRAGCVNTLVNERNGHVRGTRFSLNNGRCILTGGSKTGGLRNNGENFSGIV